MNVKPLSRTPALFARIRVVTSANPYVMLALIPQYKDAGKISVTELKRSPSIRINHGAKATYVHPMVPVYLGSLAPKVTSFVSMGSKERLKSS